MSDSVSNAPLSRVISQNTDASASYDKEGKRIEGGKKTKRLQLDAHKDDRLLIATASVGQSILGKTIQLFTKSNPFTATITFDNGAKAEVNIRSLAKRLHLTEKEINKAASIGNLEVLIKQQTANLSEALNYYETFTKKWDDLLRKEPTQASSKQGPPAPTLTQTSRLNARTTMNVMKAAVRTTNPSGLVRIQDVSREHTFIFAKNRDKKEIFLIPSDQISATSILGSGNFGEAFRVSPEAENGPLVLKLAKNRPDNHLEHQRAREDVLHEAEIVHYLTDGLNAKGIMLTPRAVLNIRDMVQTESSNTRDFVGYLVHQFTCDVASLGEPGKPQLSPMQKLSGFINILEGLKLQEQKGVCHGDIKVENMSYHAENGAFRLIDYGGAIRYNEMTSTKLQEMYNNGSELGVLTPNMCYLPNIVKIKQAAQNGDVSAYQQGLRERDQFAVAMSLLDTTLGQERVDELFTKNPNGAIESCKIEKEELDEKLALLGYPPGLGFLIFDLMGLDPIIDIPTTKDALAQLETFYERMVIR